MNQKTGKKILKKKSKGKKEKIFIYVLQIEYLRIWKKKKIFFL